MRRAICGLLVLSVVSAQTWLEWSAWNGDCKAAGAVAQTRFRVCKPPKEGPAAPCFGDSTEVLACKECPAQGTWGEWTVMDGCSDNCGAHGRRFRTRACKKPIGCHNVACPGEARETEEDGAPCDHQSPCLLPKRACHPDYKMAIDAEEGRPKCLPRTPQ
ncbi:hypothetical protein PRIPAC_95697 [Pristionchus pacificus]|uniref:Uncharacterized protein n=1 Tax=Pristionchus pacificus TaxID=54126 RepID=A0A2A6BD71_PRIPA|nr:hypothetical protein PRIPAC_95697 [Pristionchus pacificus]|eukprot:PDM63850.1 hypothetical protein PRIPAC_49823 [Pristionchus pacificus]